MAISVILISSDSSKESVGTSTTQVILFGMIPTTIPSTIPTIDSPTIPTIAPTIQYSSPFIWTNSSDSDTSERLPSQDLYEVTIARWRIRVVARSSQPLSPVYDSPPSLHHILPTPPKLPRRPVVLVLPGQPIPVGRPYPDYSSSDHFTLDDSSRDSLSDSSSETSSDSHSDTPSNSSLRHSSSGHSILGSPCVSPTAISTRLSRKRHRSPTTSVPVASPVSSEEGFVSHVPKEIGLGVDVEDSYEPYTEPDIDPDVQADIDACITFVDDIAARGTDVRVEVGTAAEEEAESSVRGMIEIGVDRVTHPVVSDDTTDVVSDGHNWLGRERLSFDRVSVMDLRGLC
ncbi:hypothetical protein Tco_1378778 [Tanacetum coccineum]